MVDASKETFEFDLGNHGGVVRFASAEELREWSQNELEQWKWVQKVAGKYMEPVVSAQRELRQQIVRIADSWKSSTQDASTRQNIFSGLEHQLQQAYAEGRIIHSGSSHGSFIFKLRQNRGDLVAAGAYAALLNAALQNVQEIETPFLEGLIEGFLYKRGIDWAPSAHEEVFNRLRQQYSDNLENQNTRFQEIEKHNSILIERFSHSLQEKSSSLDKVREEQSAEFQKAFETHVQNLKAIELTYDQKLALQTPVKYWRTKERHHSRLAKWFGAISGIAATVLLFLLGVLVHWVFANLKSEDEPKHWQIGVLAIAAFFVIWVVRIFVRLFFSNLHLAADAAERRTMILTYLSMSREGAQFAPEDKTLIVQHLFRAASDGLVKDDAAPPTLLEYLSRK